MSRRIEDLASKLSQAEKKNRKLEKKNARRNSKTLESDLPLSVSAPDADTSTNSDLAETGSEDYCAERVTELSTVHSALVQDVSSRESSAEPCPDNTLDNDPDKCEYCARIYEGIVYFFFFLLFNK